jgi:hypothetical protein
MRPCAIFLIVSVALGQCAYSPPPNSKLLTVGGRPYYAGSVYLSTHGDTTALQALGFRNFEFEGRSVRCVKYHARWPKSTNLSALPKCVSGLDYEMLPTAKLETDADVFDVPNRQIIVRRDGSASSVSRGLIEELPVSPSGRQIVKMPYYGFCGKFDPDDVYLVPRSQLPVIEGMPTGTFMTMPREGDIIHKPENMGDARTRNPGMFRPTPPGELEGTYRLTPQSTLEMTGIQRQYYYHDGPATGSTFRSALPQGDQYWLRAGQPVRYQGMSPSEYLRQQNRRR